VQENDRDYLPADCESAQAKNDHSLVHIVFIFTHLLGESELIFSIRLSDAGAQVDAILLVLDVGFLVGGLGHQGVCLHVGRGGRKGCLWAAAWDGGRQALDRSHYSVFVIEWS